MKVIDSVKKRRSVRQYLDTVPEERDIMDIIEAGIWAPSGLNNQPWKFKVLNGGRKDAISGFTRYGAVIKDAPVAVLVFLDNSRTYNREKDLMSAGACIQNMLLRACEMGIASCWLGEILNKRDKVEKAVSADQDHELVAVITFGYSDEEIVKSCRRPLKSFII